MNQHVDHIIILAGAHHPDLEKLKAIDSELYHNHQTKLVVGVDRGGLILIQNGVSPDIALGDFDSVTPEEEQLIEENIKANQGEILRFSPIKDDTDLQIALLKIKKYIKKTTKINIFGALGNGRLDHLLANIWLANDPRFIDMIEYIKFFEKEAIVQFCTKQEYEFSVVEGFKYFSLVMLTPVEQLSIENAVYNLDTRDFPQPAALISNEFIDQQKIKIQFKKGIIAAMWIKEASR